ncbi:MAG: hypothetical protein KKB82_02745 [Candidatus Omnitrophica bacterium]|nr:hypothetical protein [Candidatus Omnitrophota bacterium]MBU1924824.1 hypothetical protein [Candidatus Omnitrophota bacterium]
MNNKLVFKIIAVLLLPGVLLCPTAWARGDYLAPALQIAYQQFQAPFQQAAINKAEFSIITAAPQRSRRAEDTNGSSLFGVPDNVDFYRRIAQKKGANVNFIYDELWWQEFILKKGFHPTTVGCFDAHLNIWIFAKGADEISLHERMTHEAVHAGHIAVYRSRRPVDKEISFIQDFNRIEADLYYAQDKELWNIFMEIKQLLRFQYNYPGIVINDFIKGNITKVEAEGLMLKFFGNQLPRFSYTVAWGGIEVDFDLGQKMFFNLTGAGLRNILAEYQNPPFSIASEFFAWAYHRLAKRAYYGPAAEKDNLPYSTYVGERLTLLMDKFLRRLFTFESSAAYSAQQRLIEHYINLGLPVMLDNSVYGHNAALEQIKDLFSIKTQSGLSANMVFVEQAI